MCRTEANLDKVRILVSRILNIEARWKRIANFKPLLLYHLEKIQLSIFSGWSGLRASLDNFGKQNTLLTLAEYKLFFNMKDHPNKKRFQNLFPFTTNCGVDYKELLYFVTNCISFGISVFIYLAQFWKEITEEM
jgi:hypothetical protein